MGSNKKHKRSRSRSRSRNRDREERKRRRRTPSPSPPSVQTGAGTGSGHQSAEQERRRHRKQRRRRSSDVEEVPVDSHLASPPPEKKTKHSESDVAVSSSKTDSLSIEESNRLRAKLGLKPLQVTEEINSDDGKIKDDLGEFYHKPADNIAEKKKREALRTKISERKQKRIIEQKLLNTTTLADSDDDDGNAVAWVQKNREISKQKEEAAKRAAILDELDAEFGIAELAAEEERNDRRKAYNAQSLQGLRVLHDVEAFHEDRDVILTLEDREILAEGDDVLVNVNIKDDERYKKSNLNKKTATGYNPYEGTDDIELYGVNSVKKVLGKYDEEINGEKKPDGFVIGDEDQLEAKRFKQMMIKEKLASKRVESLVLPDLKIASEYFTEDEIKAKFKRPKKKGKMRKQVKEEIPDEDIIEINGALITDDTEVKEEASVKAEIEENEEEEDTELELALAKARRHKLAEQQRIPKLEDFMDISTKEEESETVIGGIVLDSTAEFCRTLGDIPTYGQAGNRDVDAEELMELERSVEAEIDESEKADGAWNSVDTVTEQVDVTRDGGGALAAEPAVGAGLAGALRLALSKGYLEKGREARAAPSGLSHLRAHHYSIDDKAHGEDEKLNRRERGYAGPTCEFREKDGFRPNVKLDYVDDDGRPLPPKEAFRYLSHKFHGKGPGKNKQEKRIKQNQQEGLMKKMSSTDTPLGTLALLQARQKEAQAAFVVLSGAKQPRNLAP